MKKEIRKEFEESVYEFCESCIGQGIVNEEQIIKEYINENKHMIKKAS